MALLIHPLTLEKCFSHGVCGKGHWLWGPILPVLQSYLHLEGDLASVMSAMGAGNWKWQDMYLFRHPVTIQRRNTEAKQMVITPGIYPATLFNR